MTSDAKPVSVIIHDKEYLISCPEQEREQLYDAVEFLNQKMREVKEIGNVFGTERVSVMAALNIANEFLAYKNEKSDYTQRVGETVQRLQSKIENILVRNDKQVEL